MPNPIKPLTAWSFSRYNDYRLCPLKAKLKYIDRIQEPANEAMERGSAIHKTAENFIKGSTKKLPKELKLLKEEFMKLQKLYKLKKLAMVVEDTWAFTKEWAITTWNDWTGCRVRIKIDCAHYASVKVMIITDWKTGKFRKEKHEEYLEQLELYALGALMTFPHVQEVRPRLGYTDQGIFYPGPDDPLIIFKRTDVDKLRKKWDKRTKAMMSDTIFAPRPSDHCRWCFFRAANKAAGGGQCKY